MKYLTLLLVFGLLCPFSLFAQDTLYQENFNSLPTSFIINSSDVGGIGLGVNYWQINDSFLGGIGQVICLGIPFNFNVPNTPAQPSAISGSPNSSYLHTVSDAAVASGVSNCTFQAADGLCTFQESYFSKMDTDISTTTYDSITFSFWWICGGGNNSFGELYYSTDGGSSWIKEPTISEYKNSGSWTKVTVTNSNFNGINSLRFGFRFFSDVTTAANDPGFGIDEIVIAGITTSLAPIANFYSVDTVICNGTCISFIDTTTNTPTSWEWMFPGATPSTSTIPDPQLICYNSPGNYNVTLVVSNPNGSDTITYINYISVNANPTVPIISQNLDTLCTTGGYSYQWYFNGTTPIPGAVDSCYQTIFPGSYTVNITDTNGCTSSSLPFVLTSVNDPYQTDVIIKIYPNPVSSMLNLEWKSHAILQKIELFSMLGKLILDIEPGEPYTNHVIDLTAVPNGTYYVRASFNNEQFYQKISVVK